jgi:formylglycine-generating enzyme required for sulfatase activity
MAYLALRGGSWYLDASFCAVSFRNYNNPSYRYYFYGFRIARGAASGDYRVLRGGSWSNVASYCAVSRRDFDYPSGRRSNFGFRVARSTKE